ncbi:MAG: dockerin type I repeat-containing protein, partial [Oscillospiraceae bacterium]
YAGADMEMIKDALESLESAKKNLTKGVSAATKTTLNNLISIAQTYKEEDYTISSWKAFSSAVDRLKEAAADPDVSVSVANAAIKAYQDAQRGLVATSLSLPATGLKAEFDAIYGEDKNLTFTGTTREGNKYTIVFNGRDITEPKDFNPEVKYESENEEAIRYEVGSASDYQLISFTQTGSFPGTASVTLDISGTYKNGSYRLYKWNSTTKKGEYVETVTVKDGSVTFKASEGGDYYISSVLQNFDMISNNLTIDHSKLTISSSFKSRHTVSAFKNSLENGSAVIVRRADGTIPLEKEYIATGMTASAPNSDVSYTIVVPGDVTGDGLVNTIDAVEILRAVVGEVTLDTYAQKAAADVSQDGWVRANDAIVILKYSVGM